MLVELNLVEQRYAAVAEVLNEGVTVTEAAARAGVTRQTVQRWLCRYAADGLAGLVDKTSKPGSCPHQMPAAIEARIVELAPRGGGRNASSINCAVMVRRSLRADRRSYRCLVRHKLIDPQARKPAV